MGCKMTPREYFVLTNYVAAIDTRNFERERRDECQKLFLKIFWYALIISPWNPGSNLGMKRKKPPSLQVVRDVKEGRLTWPLGGIMTGNDFKFFPIFEGPANELKDIKINVLVDNGWDEIVLSIYESEFNACEREDLDEMIAARLRRINWEI